MANFKNSKITDENREEYKEKVNRMYHHEGVAIHRICKELRISEVSVDRLISYEPKYMEKSK